MILLINSLTSGGAERVVLTLVDKFIERKRKVNLVLIERQQFYEAPKKAATHFLTTYETLDHNILKLPFLFISALRLKKQTEKESSIVQSHLPRANCTNILAKMMGGKHKTQLVIHSSTNFDSKSRLYRFLGKWLMRQVFDRADSLVFISEVMRRELNAYFKLSNSGNQAVIYNPHILDEIREKANEELTGFQFDPEKKYLVFAGRIVSLKRIGDILAAFEQVSLEKEELELLILGEGDETKALKQQVAMLNLSAKVHFLGYQSNPYAFIARADILLLASDREGLPNILIESMACGTPVISSDCISGPREIISPDSDLDVQLKNKIEVADYGILYPVGKVFLLAEAICIMLSNEGRYQAFVQKGLERAEDFDAEAISQQYLEVLG